MVELPNFYMYEEFKLGSLELVALKSEARKKITHGF